MPSADQVKALISSLTEGDEAHFYSVAMQIAAHEARMGHGKLAEEIAVLSTRPSRGRVFHLKNLYLWRDHAAKSRSY